MWYMENERDSRYLLNLTGYYKIWLSSDFATETVIMIYKFTLLYSG